MGKREVVEDEWNRAEWQRFLERVGNTEVTESIEEPAPKKPKKKQKVIAGVMPKISIRDFAKARGEAIHIAINKELDKLFKHAPCTSTQISYHYDGNTEFKGFHFAIKQKHSGHGFGSYGIPLMADIAEEVASLVRYLITKESGLLMQCQLCKDDVMGDADTDMIGDGT